jgi:polyisoprenoid-binding protein YceI
MKFRAPLSVLLALFLAQLAHAETVAMPSGVYRLDPRHTSVIFRLSHLGFSYFTGRFDACEGVYDYHAETPASSGLDVTIRTSSVDTNDAELDETLVSENWFDALKYPKAVFHATSIEITDEHTAKITGDFTLHGVTNPLVLDATLVGAGRMPLVFAQGKQIDVMGFSAVGHFSRAAYGISNLEPFVGDEITLQIDSEFDKE